MIEVIYTKKWTVSWYELQQFVEYKAQAKGIATIYVNPVYTSQTCSKFDCLVSRHKHLFKCLNCGSYQHSDRNAAINLLRLGETVSRQWYPSMRFRLRVRPK